MTSDEEAADRYRARAEEIRAIASGVRDRGCRETLVDIADDYEAMARIRDKLSTSYKARNI